MFGLSIIKKKELERLLNVNQLFTDYFGEKQDENFHLSERIKILEKEVKQLTRIRDEKGRYVKK
ncbi:MAG: hypothetical protein LBT29_02445 [Flavobacteriaceae bacterium]|jgi:hypothetical protein|nr:hypothetical protein [Flavobacteriaceae bacterium]